MEELKDPQPRRTIRCPRVSTRQHRGYLSSLDSSHAPGQERSPFTQNTKNVFFCDRLCSVNVVAMYSPGYDLGRRD
eukprot:3759470-Rhodomonas_salina.2